MVVWATLGIATTVLLEATLSFLGIGVQPPTPSWGNMLSNARQFWAHSVSLVILPISTASWTCAGSSVSMRRASWSRFASR